jgi:hypothetical protein
MHHAIVDRRLVRAEHHRPLAERPHEELDVLGSAPRGVDGQPGRRG